MDPMPKGDKMRYRYQYQSHQIFHIARKALSDGQMHEIFGRTTRYMQMWAADPRHCEVTRRNVLDQVALFLDALDDHGRRDVAHAALDLLAAPLGFSVVEKDKTTVSDKGCPDLELADLAVAIGELGARIREALKDGRLETVEIIRIRKAHDAARQELDQLLDAGTRREP